MSNQVYRDKSSAIPYNGELSGALVPILGNIAGAGSIRVNFVRVSPSIAGMQITSSAVGVVWGGSDALSSMVGAIPLGFRPAVYQAVYGVTVKPTMLGVVNVLSLFNINIDGNFSMFHPDSVTGESSAIPDGTIFANQLLLWCTDAI